MIKNTSLPTLTSAMLLIGLLSGTCAAESNTGAEYCSSSKLYATNIRSSCSQLGANGMAALYKTSDFINGLKAGSKVISNKPAPNTPVITKLKQPS
jgi:hypothetical protein